LDGGALVAVPSNLAFPFNCSLEAGFWSSTPA